MNFYCKQVDFGDREHMGKYEQAAQRIEHKAQNTAAEQQRIAAVARLNMAPASCGPAIVRVAPARGFMILFQEVVYQEQPDGSYKAISDAFDGRDALRCADAFDVMAAQASRAKVFDLFTPEQVGMGRRYRTITERYKSAGIKCSSVEGIGGGSGDGGDFMDRVIIDGDELRRLHRWIGKGTAKAVRCVRPSQRGSRALITDQALVDAVCLRDKTISEVLRDNGWSVKGDTVKALRASLCGVLDRMIGKRIRHKTLACNFGSGHNFRSWQ